MVRNFDSSYYGILNRIGEFGLRGFHDKGNIIYRQTTDGGWIR